jgi:hypothetical protein
VVTTADVGARLRVRLTVVNAAGRDFAESASTAVVAALAPAAASGSGVSGSGVHGSGTGEGTGSGGPAGTAAASEFPRDLIATMRAPASRARLRVRVSSVRCSHRACTATVVASGPAATVRVVLRRGSHSLSWTRRTAARRPMHVVLRPRARLRAGRYTVVASATGASGATETARRVLTVR